MKLVKGGCYLALSQVDGEHKRLPCFSVHRVIWTYVQTPWSKLCTQNLLSLYCTCVFEHKNFTLSTFTLKFRFVPVSYLPLHLSAEAVCRQNWLWSGKFRFSKVDSMAEVCLLSKTGSVVQRKTLSSLSQLHLNQTSVSRKISGTTFTNSYWEIKILLAQDNHNR